MLMLSLVWFVRSVQYGSLHHAVPDLDFYKFPCMRRLYYHPIMGALRFEALASTPVWDSR